MQQWRLVMPRMPVNCDPALRITGLFLERYLSGPYGTYNHRLGCPTGPEIDHPAGAGNGRYQTFEHGAMAYSPSTGPKSVQIGYYYGGLLNLDWFTTDPFHYDRYTVRYDKDGQNVGQDDLDGFQLNTEASGFTRPRCNFGSPTLGFGG